MESIRTFHAKVHLSALLDRVARAERFMITRRGIPAEMLVPFREAANKLTHEQIVEGMRELRKRVKPDRMRVREMVRERRPRQPGPKPSTQRSKEPMRVENHPAFGIWADREDMKDPSAWLRKIRAPRYDRLGRRRPKPA
jgi:antitoxin (DNA-binding transcriptional repressor) of toxin-antitoxin stability system